MFPARLPGVLAAVLSVAGIGAAAHGLPPVSPPPEALQRSLKLSPFYRKHVSAGGFPVLGSARTA